MTTLDILGEYITNKEQALRFKDECTKVIEAIKNENLVDENLSVKPTQVGLLLDEGFASMRRGPSAPGFLTVGPMCRNYFPLQACWEVLRWSQPKFL